MEYLVKEIRATGITPEAVSAELSTMLSEQAAAGWILDRIQPIIFNSSTTGYLLVIFSRDE